MLILQYLSYSFFLGLQTIPGLCLIEQIFIQTPAVNKDIKELLQSPPDEKRTVPHL